MPKMHYLGLGGAAMLSTANREAAVRLETSEVVAYDRALAILHDLKHGHITISAL